MSFCRELNVLTLPHDLERLILSYLFLVPFEHVFAVLERLMSADWLSCDDNRIEVEFGHSKTAVQVHSFFSTQTRCGGDVYPGMRPFINQFETLSEVSERVVKANDGLLQVSFFVCEFLPRSFDTPKSVLQTTGRNPTNGFCFPLQFTSGFDALIDLTQIKCFY
jgi:hypothetical protein